MKAADMPDMPVDSVDRAILDCIQTAFPLVSRPYALIGERAGVTEHEAFARVQAMRGRGLIRRIGANFQSAKLGFRSTLCAAKVPEASLEAFVAAVNKEQGVTHNYLRNHAYNVWFTCIGESWEAVLETLERISRSTGICLLNLPASRLYKIKVDFQMNE